MKQSAINTLITAKAIYSKAKPLINSGNKHSCTAGIILLQDSVELVILALLDEIGADEIKSLESKSFDELVGELKKQKIPVVKSGTVKALNKQRVIAKHYGQLVEPSSAITYLNAVNMFIEGAIGHVYGKTLQDILLVDLIPDGKEKQFLLKAIKLRDEKNFLDGLIELRKAFFISYEREYCIDGWRDYSNNGSEENFLLTFLRGGLKASYWKRNKEWIEENVKTPTDYIQIEVDQFKMDCMEWGLNTSEVENIRRLTPGVFQFSKDEDKNWHIIYDFHFPANNANKENFDYCIEAIINFLIRKNEHQSIRKWPSKDKLIPAPPIYIGHNIFEKPDSKSGVIGKVMKDYSYSIDKIVSGFDASETFYYVHLYQDDEKEKYGKNHIRGYILKINEEES